MSGELDKFDSVSLLHCETLSEYYVQWVDIYGVHGYRKFYDLQEANKFHKKLLTRVVIKG